MYVNENDNDFNKDHYDNFIVVENFLITMIVVVFFLLFPRQRQEQC